MTFISIDPCAHISLTLCPFPFLPAEALMEWLALEPTPAARIALKHRIHGYITRAEELKALLEPGASPDNGAAGKTGPQLPLTPPPKPERRQTVRQVPDVGGAAAAMAVANGAATTSNNSSSNDSNDEDQKGWGKDTAAAILAATIPTTDDHRAKPLLPAGAAAFALRRPARFACPT